MRSVIGTIVAALFGSAPFSCLSAQPLPLRVEVQDSVTRQPLAGAVITLRRDDGSLLVQGLTTDRSGVTLPRDATPAVIRVVRIGYRPWVRRLTASDTQTVSVELVRLPTLLTAVTTTARAQCPVTPTTSLAVGAWEQAQAALLAAVVARESAPSVQLRYAYERRLRDSIAQMRVEAESASVSTASFGAALTADQFVHVGFVDRATAHTRYYGPDAEVLLSEPFASAYCIALASPAPLRSTQVGLTFAPARRNSSRVDIRGTLWVDTAARALRDIEFEYLGLDPTFTGSQPGGTVSFRELPNGVVLVDRWAIRTRSAVVDTLWATPTVPVQRISALSKEFGGMLIRADWPTFTWEPPLAALDLLATDRAGVPKRGIHLALADTPHGGVTSEDGRIRFDRIIDGPYQLVARDSSLTPVDWTIPLGAPFQLSSGEQRAITASIPSVREYTLARCISLGQEANTEGVVVLGRALRRDITGALVAVDQVTLSFALGGDGADYEQVRLLIGTGSDGIFQLCLPASARGLRLRVRASRGRGGRSIGEAEMVLSTETVVLPVFVTGRVKR